MIILQLDPEQLSNLIQDAVCKAIAEMPNGEQSQTSQILNIQEASEFLHLTKPTVYGYVSRSAIPVSKIGKRLYFSKQELTEWIKTGRKKTIAEISDEANTYLKKK
jgi:excisionase family DNA binding protein